MNIHSQNKAFTLAEVLITLGIIGVVASLVVPVLMQKQQESQWVSGLLEFDSLIHQSVQSWRSDVGCTEEMYKCLAEYLTNLHDSDRHTITDKSLDQVVAGLKIVKTACDTDCSETLDNADWLPDQTYLYNGANQNSCSYGCSLGGVSKQSTKGRLYMLSNGMNFMMQNESYNNTGVIHLFVDVNGKKPPNRFGKDTFPFTIGELSDSLSRSGNDDIVPFPRDSGSNACDGMCGPYNGICNPDNTDPTKYGGASPTAYVLLNHKIPDFAALSKSVANFKP